MERMFGFMIAISLLCMCAASADESFGVPVYPGAKFDAVTTRVLKEKIHINGFCYRTDDSVEKVAEFYKNQGLELSGDITKEGALYQTKTGVNVSIQNPWLDMNTGNMMKDTLISIVKLKE
jgi:hypothetical protein